MSLSIKNATVLPTFDTCNLYDYEKTMYTSMQEIIMQNVRKEFQAVRVTGYASTFHGTYPLQERLVHTKSW